MWIVLVGLGLAFFVPNLDGFAWGIALLWVSISGAVLLWSVRRFEAMSLWVIAIVVGVWATHNFAAPRYLGLAILPFVLLLDKEQIHPIWTKLLVAFSFSLSGMIAFSEHKHAVSTAQLMSDLPLKAQVSGEWTVRWVARTQGMSIWKGDPSTIVQPKQAVGGSIPKHYRLLNVHSSSEGYRMLLDREASVGFYSETLGFWPLGFQYGALEELRIWSP